MINKKIAIIGSVGSGKTTLIENMSEIEAINTDVASSVDIGKEMTTVGMDYGEIRVDGDLKLGLYGVPGQRKFSFMWDFVKEGLWAVVILIRNNQKDSVLELEHLLDYFEINAQTPCMVCITHADQSNSSKTKQKVREILQGRELNLPIYSIDASLKRNAELIFKTLIMLEETKNESHS